MYPLLWSEERKSSKMGLNLCWVAMSPLIERSVGSFFTVNSRTGSLTRLTCLGDMAIRQITGAVSRAIATGADLMTTLARSF
jgi:hypothetical protein